MSSRAGLVVLLVGAAALGGAFWYARTRQASGDQGGGGMIFPDFRIPSLDELQGDAGTWGADVYQAAESAASDAVDLTAGILEKVGIKVRDWQATAARPENAPYVDAMHRAEQRHGIPSDMLVRLAWQESRFRRDIIEGRKVSSAGAVGIMQIVPKWHPNVNPLDPFASIDYAAGYLAQLYRQFGTWAEALAAYNWGPGNLRKYGLARAPLETRNYYGQILADLGMGGTYA